jgi:hypothetical protein
MVTIPCVALKAVEEIPKEVGVELINRWLQLGIEVECFRHYRRKS